MAATNTADLAARIAELEAENHALRSGNGLRAATAPGQRGRGAAVAAAALIAVGLFLGTAGVIVSTAKDQLLDTDRFVASFAPLAEDPEVQAVVVTTAMGAIDSAVDIPALTAPVFDGLDSLGLPPRASAALGLLQAPVNQGLHSFVESQVEDFVISPAFAEIWATSLRTTHAQLLATMQGASDAALSIDGTGSLALELGPIIAEVRERLIANGMEFATLIPTVDRRILLVEDSSLAALPGVYALTIAVGAWLPWIAFSLIIAGVLLARRRRRALIVTSIAAGALMFIPGVAFAVGRIVLTPMFLQPGSPLTIGAAQTLYDAATGTIIGTTSALGTIAVITAITAWLGGSGRAASALRDAVASATATGRSAAERRGLTTGAFGRWIDKHHTPVLLGVLVVATAVVVLSRPLTPGVVLAAAALAALAALALAFLRRPAPIATASTGQEAIA